MQTLETASFLNPRGRSVNFERRVLAEASFLSREYETAARFLLEVMEQPCSFSDENESEVGDGQSFYSPSAKAVDLTRFACCCIGLEKPKVALDALQRAISLLSDLKSLHGPFPMSSMDPNAMSSCRDNRIHVPDELGLIIYNLTWVLLRCDRFIDACSFWCRMR